MIEDDKTPSSKMTLDQLYDELMEQPKDPEDAAPLFHFSLVLTEVVYRTDKGVSSHRCQLFSKSDMATYPKNRIGQLQNSSAIQAQADLTQALGRPPKDFAVIEVLILAIHPLGWMTDAQFEGPKKVSNNPVDEKPADPTDNVLPLRRP